MASASGFGISSDPLLAAALVSALAALAASALLIAAVLALRWRTRAAHAAGERVRARWRPRFAAAALAAEGAGLAPETPGAAELRTVLELWNQATIGMKGAARERLAEFGRRCGFAAAAAGLIGRRAMQDRLLGLATLGQLAEKPQFSAVHALASDPRPAVSLAAARALIRIDAAEALVALLPQILDRADWPVARLADALREGSPDGVADLLALALERAPSRDQARLLALARIVPPTRIAPQVRAILAATKEPETLIAALKLVVDPRDAALVRPMLAHPDWPVRVAAVQTLGRIATREDLPALAGALADSSWWVRQRAAGAIVALPYLDAAEIEDLRARAPDPFAADALARAIAEKQVAR